MRTNKQLIVAFDAQPLFQPKRSGIGYYTFGLIQALAQAHPDQIKLIGYHFNKGPGSAELPTAANIEYRQCGFMSERLLNLLRRFRLDPPLEVFLRDRIDFALYPNYHGLRSFRSTPSACVVHDIAYLDQPETLTRKNQQDLERLLPGTLKRSAFVISVSEFTAKRLKACYTFMSKKSIVVSSVPPQKKTSKSSAVAKLDKKKYILFVGTLEPRKNIERLVQAYKDLPGPIRSKFRLVIAGGQGWKSEAIVQAIKSAQQNSYSVDYLGYVTEPEKEYIYTHASLLVQPSLYEGFGMPILEAMQRGLPVLASNLDVFKEIAGNGAAYFDPLNEGSLTTAMTELLKEQKRLSELKNRGQEVVKTYSWERVAADIYTSIKKACNQRD